MLDDAFDDVFEFDDLCSIVDCLLTAASESVFPPALELKSLPGSLKYTFIRPDESLPIIIASDLD